VFCASYRHGLAEEGFAALARVPRAGTRQPSARNKSIRHSSSIMTDPSARGPEREEGCFVYQIVNGNVSLRSRPDTSDESRIEGVFREGDLVAVDLRVVDPYSRYGVATGSGSSDVNGNSDGPFLRLADHRGWLFENKNGSATAKRIPVEKGLWCLCVDNYPTGIAPRYHLIDKSEFKQRDSLIRPLQMVYCDRKVVHPTTGACWYRLQGTTNLWIFDRRVDDEEDDHYMLLDESQVKEGLRAYVALSALAIRSAPDVGDDARTERYVREGDMVAVSAVRQSPFRHGNGPFLHLADGSGWLFVNKHNETVMEEVPIEEGRWSFRVLNSPTGIAARRHPLDDATMSEEENDYKVDEPYPPGSHVECDRRIRSPHDAGVNFYRVEGTDGWIFDKRDGEPVLELISSGPHPSTTSLPSSSAGNGGQHGWSIDFLRGVAASVPGLQEIGLNETSRVMSFRTEDGVRVNVYYTTRTVGTALHHIRQGKTQLFRRDCSVQDLIDILKNPRVHTAKGYKRKRSGCSGSFSGLGLKSATLGNAAMVHTAADGSTGVLVDVEEELRNEILETDEELRSLRDKRLRLCRIVRGYDEARCKAAADRRALVLERESELDSIAEARAAAQAKAAQARAAKEERQRRERTCAACGRMFGSVGARDQHSTDAHGYVCHTPSCGRIFQSFNSLYQHRNAVNHH